MATMDDIQTLIRAKKHKTDKNSRIRLLRKKKKTLHKNIAIKRNQCQYIPRKAETWYHCQPHVTCKSRVLH